MHDAGPQIARRVHGKTGWSTQRQADTEEQQSHGQRVQCAETSLGRSNVHNAEYQYECTNSFGNNIIKRTSYRWPCTKCGQLRVCILCLVEMLAIGNAIR